MREQVCNDDRADNRTDRLSLQEAIEATPLLADEKKLLSPTIALVLAHDLLLAKGGIQAPDGPIKQAVMRHRTRIQAEWVKLKIKRGVPTDQGLAQAPDSRASLYLRRDSLCNSLTLSSSACRLMG